MSAYSSKPLSAAELDGIVSRLRVAGCVFAEDEARLLVSAADTPTELTDLVDRRVAGLPLEHVLGWAEFGGLRIAVDPGVFVPRRRTEFLVHQAVALAGTSTVLLDLCCGSGAVGVAIGWALAAAGGSVELHAADIEPAAVRCARRNLAPLGGRVHQGDLYRALPADLRGRVDILVANVPYVPTDEIELMPPEARLYEPRVALDGGVDGLAVLRRASAEAPRWLAPGGQLLIETSERQAPISADAFARSGLIPRVASSADHYATVVVGHL
jgi:release factor glutamine methyltransferase